MISSDIWYHIKWLVYNTYLYIHVCIYIFICIYIYIFMYMYMYTYIYIGDMPQADGNTSFTRVAWRFHMSDVNYSFIYVVLPFPLRHWPLQSTRAYVRRASFICMTWLIHTFDMNHPYVRRHWCICVTWLIQMCDMTRLYMWHDSFTYVSCHPRTYAWHNSLMCDTWLIHVCDVTHSCGRHNFCICDFLICATSCICVTWRMLPTESTQTTP